MKAKQSSYGHSQELLAHLTLGALVAAVILTFIALWHAFSSNIA
jgi:hypothetical protein